MYGVRCGFAERRLCKYLQEHKHAPNTARSQASGPEIRRGGRFAALAANWRSASPRNSKPRQIMNNTQFNSAQAPPRASFRLDARRVGLALAVSASVAAPSALYAQAIGVQINGNPVRFAEAAPLNAAGSVLVPMRGVFEAMQASVNFVPSTNTIIAKRGEREIQLSLGSTSAYVNGAAVTLSQPARSIGGRTFVPLRFVADALGARVAWNAQTNTVLIEDPSIGQGAGVGGGAQPAAPAGPTVTLERVDLNEPARIVVRENGALRSYEMAANAEAFRQVGSGAAFGPLVPVELQDLRPGEDMKLTQANGLVTQIVAQRTVRAARVRSINGNQIVLDDGTALTISNRVRFFGAAGREAAIPDNLAAGTPVALYVRPQSNVVYAVSASAGDVAAANSSGMGNGNGTGVGSGFGNGVGNGTGTNLGNGTGIGNGGGTGTASGNGGRITLVQHNATRPLAAGGQLNVEVRGTPGARGTFDLSPRLRNLPLREEQAGVYRATYTVRAGDDVLNSFVTAHLSTAAGATNASNANMEDVAQSREPLTIDTIAPRIVNLQPRNGSVVTDARPTITADVSDVGGSGLATARMTVTAAGGQAFEVPMTIVPPSRAQAIIDRALAGRVTLRFSIADAAGNTSEANAAITVQPRAGAITSVVHDATRPLRQGSTLTVDMQAPQGGRATFDLVDERGQVVSQHVPMTEVNPGRYRGTQTLQQLPEAARLRVRAHFDDGAGTVDNLDATNDVPLAARDTRAFSITSPTANEAAGPNVSIRGRGTPGSLVDVTVTAKGTRTLFGLIGYQPYQQVLDTKQVQVDAAGNWTAGPIALSVPKNVTGASYEVSAQQTEAGNIKSQPQTVTIGAAQ